jgi:hypothetical protein
MTKYTKYVELSCVLHVFCDNEISYFLPLVFVILNGNVFDVTAHGKFFYCRQIYFSNLRISFYLDVVYTICNSLTSIIFIKVEYIPFILHILCTLSYLTRIFRDKFACIQNTVMYTLHMLQLLFHF